jgi:superfamily II DNA or RNA helicase
VSGRTYGTLDLQPGKPERWRVTDLTPHVAIAFKRLFHRVPADATELFLSDTDEVRADLLWFMQRYPLATRMKHLLEAGARRIENRMAERERILLPEWEPQEVKGFRPNLPPYKYQVQAAQIALDNGGLLLGDEVGLGKTNSAIAAIIMGAPCPAGVVVQANLSQQWADRIERFTFLRVHVVATTMPYTLPPADIYIFRYTNIAGWVDFLKNGFLKSVIYDEIQELRHGTTTDKGRAASIISGRAKFKMGLTATPIYNYGDEIHAVMHYLNPDLLGSYAEFSREWCRDGKIVKDPDALGSFLRETGWFLRRDEDDPTVNGSMPPANVVNVPVEWNTDDAADDAAITRALALSVLEGSFTTSGRAARELNIRMRHMTGVAKARAVAAYVRLLLREAPRVVLVGWHHDVYAILERLLAEFNPVSYNGSLNGVGKQRSVERFTLGNSRVLLLSLRSGAGLDGLQYYCNDIVFGEFDWSPQVHHQCAGRLRRPGQEGQVNIHNLYTNDGSDPVLIETLGIKSDQMRGVNAPGEAPKKKFSDDTHLKRLAQHVLDAPPPATTAPPPCGMCDEPSNGTPVHILPLEQAAAYPAGPYRDAFFGPDNIWHLCDTCTATRA